MNILKEMYISGEIWISRLFHMTISPEQRIYWPCLLSSLLMGIIVLKWQGKNPGEELKNFFSTKQLFHPSSLLDIKLLIFNSGLKLFLFPLFFVSGFSIAVAFISLKNQYLPHFEGFHCSPFVQSVGGTLVAFLVNDLFRFLWHLGLHRTLGLSKIHQVHHSATVLTPLTLFRVHPFESFLAQLRNALISGTTLALFSLLFVGQVSVVDFLGVNLFGFLFNMIGSNLRHSHVSMGFGVLEYIFISPRMHQLHHSGNPIHWGKNYGIALAVWDQLWGSFYRPEKEERIDFGLQKILPL